MPTIEESSQVIERPSQVVEACIEQEKLVEELLSITNVLEQRLATVTRSLPPSPPMQQGAPKIQQVPLAARLMEDNDKIRTATTRLKLLIERLEL